MLQKLKTLVHQHKHVQVAQLTQRSFSSTNSNNGQEDEFSLDKVNKKKNNKQQQPRKQKRAERAVTQEGVENQPSIFQQAKGEVDSAIWERENKIIDEKVETIRQKRLNKKEIQPDSQKQEKIDIEAQLRKEYPELMQQLETEFKKIQNDPQAVAEFHKYAQETLKTESETFAKEIGEIDPAQDPLKNLPGKEIFDANYIDDLSTKMSTEQQRQHMIKLLDRIPFNDKDVANPYYQRYQTHGAPNPMIEEDHELTEDIDRTGKRTMVQRKKTNKKNPSQIAYENEPEVTQEQADNYFQGQLSMAKATHEQLAQYKLTNQLLSVLEQKLSGNDESQAYLESRLKTSKSGFNHIILKSLKDRNSLASNIDQSITNHIQEKELIKAVDSFTTGHRQLHHEDGYVPSNDFDVSQYQRHRKYLTAQEYFDLKQDQSEKWREFYDTPEGLFVDPIDFPDYKLDSKGKIRIDTRSPEQRERLQYLEDKYALLKAGIDMDKYDNDHTTLQREMIREQTASINQKKGQQFDQPSLDLERDLHFEHGQELANADMPKFDLEAFKRTKSWMKLQFCENPSLEVQKANMRYKADTVSEELKQRIQNEFSDYQNLHQSNLQMREQVAYDFKAVRDLWKQIQQERMDLIETVKSKIESEIGRNEIKSTSLLDSFLNEEKESEYRWLLQRREELKQAQQVEYDPSNTSAAHSEQELLFISKRALLSNGEVEPHLYQYEFVFKNMEEKGVRMSSDARARMFEYAVFNRQSQLANVLLDRLCQDGVGAAPILPEMLEKFFEQSLRSDNIDGVAYLAHYCELNDVDVSGWDINRFRSALNHYMNVDYNLSKLLTFTKFHNLYYSSRAHKVLGSLSEDQVDQATLEKASSAIFSNSDHLVDLTQLFNFLSNQIGSERVIDPLTKQDCLWQIVEHQTRDPLYYKASLLSENTRISPLSISQYLGHQLNQGNQTLKKVLLVGQRMDQAGQGEAFAHSMLQEIRQYQNENGRLPFGADQTREIYYKIRQQGIKQSASNEIILFLLTQNGLGAEVADLCAQLDNSSVKEYYLSEALLKSNQNNFEQAVDMAIQDKSKACGITQKTKAMILDGKKEEAVQYFKNEVEKIRLQNKSRKEMLAQFYDDVYSKADLSFDEFKSTHARASIKAQQLAKEVFAVHQLQSIIQNKDFDQIENLFSFYTLLKEQRHLESLRPKFEAQGMQQEYEERLSSNIQRQEEIMAALGDSELYLKMLDLDKVFKLDEVKSLANANQNDRQALLDLFKDVTLEELDEMQGLKDESGAALRLDQYLELRRKKQEKAAIYGTDTEDITDLEEIEALPPSKEKDSRLQLFEQKQKNRLELKQNQKKQEQKLAESQKEFNKKEKTNFWSETEGAYKGIARDMYDMKPDLKANLYNEFDRQYDPADPTNQAQIMEFWHDTAQNVVHKYMEYSPKTLGKPSEQSMAAAEQMLWDYNFAKRIDKRYNRFGRYKKRAHKDKIKQFEKTYLEQYNHKVDDLNDPVILLHTAYDETMLGMKEDLINAIKERKKNVLSLAFGIFTKIQNQKFNMKSLTVEYDEVAPEQSSTNVAQDLQNLSHLVDDARSPILSLLIDTEKYHLPIPDSYEQYYQTEDDYLNPIDIDRLHHEQGKLGDAASYCKVIYDKLIGVKRKIFEERIKLESGNSDELDFDQRREELLHILYNDFKQNQQFEENLTQEEKVVFMQKALSQLGEKYTTTAFPSFYALDLVSFGLQHKQPEAIRLGEQLLQSEGQQMPKDLQKAVREYLLNSSNQESYREGMKITGLQDVSSIYHTQSNEDDYQTHSVFSKSDSKWMEFMAKNSKRQDQYRTPSAWAYSHKRHGLAGEVCDMKAYEQKLSKMSLQL